MRYLIPLGVVAALVLGELRNDVFALTLVPTYPVTLTAADKATLERVVCEDPHRVRAEEIEAWSYDPAGKGVSADVLCRSHEAVKGKPVRHFARCEGKGTSWSCDEGETEVLVSAGAHQLAVRTARGVDRSWGVEIVESLVEDGWFRKELDAGNSPRCYVVQGSAPEWADVQCAGWTITVSSWCPQEDCPRVVSAHQGGY